MNVNQFRIGNKVFFGDPKKETTITAPLLQLIDRGAAIVAPIFLTESIVEKYLLQIEVEMVIPDGKYLKFRNTDIKLYMKYRPGGGVEIQLTRILHPSVTMLHELQNFYFVFTKKELSL